MVSMIGSPGNSAANFLRTRTRQTYTHSFPDTASVYRIHTQEVTSDFGHNTLWELLGTYPASYWTISGQEALVLGQVDVEGDVTLRLPYDADVTERDQIVYHVRETARDIHFEVTFVNDRTLPLDTRVTCKEIKFIQPDMTVG